MMNKPIKEIIQNEFDGYYQYGCAVSSCIIVKNRFKKELKKLRFYSVFNLLIIPIPFYLKKRNKLIKAINNSELLFNDEYEKLKSIIRKHKFVELDYNDEISIIEVVQTKYKLNQIDFLYYNDYPSPFETCN